MLLLRKTSASQSWCGSSTTRFVESLFYEFWLAWRDYLLRGKVTHVTLQIDSLKKQCEDCQKENAEFRRRRNVSQVRQVFSVAKQSSSHHSCTILLQEIRAEDSTIVQRVVALIEECSPKKEDSTEIAVESGGDAARCVVKGIQDIMSTSIRYKSCGNLLSSLLKDLEKTDTSTPPTPATIFSPESLKSANASNDVLVRFRVFAFATSLVWAREYVRSRRFARTVQRQTEELQRLRELSFTLQSEAKQTDSSSSGGMVYDNMEMGHMNSSEFKTTSSGDSNQETSESTSLVSTKSLPEEDSEGPLSEERDEPNARSLPDDDQAAAIERKRWTIFYCSHFYYGF